MKNLAPRGFEPLSTGPEPVIHSQKFYRPLDDGAVDHHEKERYLYALCNHIAKGDMMFIKKIFDKAIDEDVHKQFTRFSKGEFLNRALTKITTSKENFKMNFSYDLIKDVIKLVVTQIEKAEVVGKLIKGKKKIEISSTISSEELKKICEENDFVLLDVTSPPIMIKCKKSLPKPGKELDAKFASAILPLKFIKEFVFDVDGTFKQATISHTFVITDIVIPEEYKNNPEQARLHAKRKGKITRILEIDGKHEEKTIEFTA